MRQALVGQRIQFWLTLSIVRYKYSLRISYFRSKKLKKMKSYKKERKKIRRSSLSLLPSPTVVNRRNIRRAPRLKCNRNKKLPYSILARQFGFPTPKQRSELSELFGDGDRSALVQEQAKFRRDKVVQVSKYNTNLKDRTKWGETLAKQVQQRKKKFDSVYTHTNPKDFPNNILYKERVNKIKRKIILKEKQPSKPPDIYKTDCEEHLKDLLFSPDFQPSISSSYYGWK